MLTRTGPGAKNGRSGRLHDHVSTPLAMLGNFRN